MKHYLVRLLKTTTVFGMVSLGLVTTAQAVDGVVIPKACQQFFAQVDDVVSQAEQQPGTHLELAQIRADLSASKAEILKLEPALQAKSCHVGLTRLSQNNQLASRNSNS